jgi:hypothetical protein
MFHNPGDVEQTSVFINGENLSREKSETEEDAGADPHLMLSSIYTVKIEH